MTIAAKVITDSISEADKRLTTLQLRYPKFIHSEFMTHRVFSRNASSSRAIPVERLIKDVLDDPVYPSFWGKNQPGMQAAEECDTMIHPPWATDPASGDERQDVWDGKRDEDYSPVLTKVEMWDEARNDAVAKARAFAAAGYHKQIVNRLIEPFCHINVVVTATEWDNFFALRCHKDAQPEIRLLAEVMRDAMAASKPKLLKTGEWHLPYVNEGFSSSDPTIPIKVSVARCARVSYLTQEGKPPNIEDDLKLYDRLVGSVPLHASPAEHQAMPDDRSLSIRDVNFSFTGRDDLNGNFKGWIQYRKQLETLGVV